MAKRGKKIGNVTRMFIVLSIFILVLFTESSFAQIGIISCPEWFIVLDDAGYADIMIQTFPGQVPHENLSGEWAAAIRYDGILTPGGVSMWLTPEFIFPYFTTNSTFLTEIPLSTWDDPANPTVGNDTGYSKISNGVVAIEISYTMYNTGTGTAVGLRPGGVGSTPPVMSGPYVLKITYKVTNISDKPLTNLCFFQFLHANPNDDHGPNNYGVYDPTQYAEAGAFQEYRYDIVQYGASVWNPPGSDITGFSSAEPPVTWGIGDFPGHAGEPATGLHHNVYNDTLPLTTSGGPSEIAGAMKWCYGTLQKDESFIKSVLLYNGYTSVQISPPPVFVDVPTSHWAYNYITAIYNNGITTGCAQDAPNTPENERRYCPEDNVTRDQMAAFIVRAVEGEPPANYCDSGTPFPDVSSAMWSCKYIKRLKELGITTGYQDGTYGPYDFVPREQMAAFIVRAVEGEPPANYCDTSTPFPDVTSDMWSCRYIKRLKELGITTGYQDGTYGPYDIVTRAQMAAFLARAFLGME